MLKSSYWLNQPEIMLLLEMFDLTDDVPLLQGQIDAKVTGAWFLGAPTYACYFEKNHYVRTFLKVILWANATFKIRTGAHLWAC